MFFGSRLPFFRHFSRRWRLQTILVLLSVLQICTVVGLTGYLSLRNGHSAVRNLAAQLQTETGKRVEQHLNSYLALPLQINALNLDAIARGQIDLQDLYGSARYFWKQSQIFKSFSFIGYYLTDNTASGAGRWAEGEGIVATIHPGGQLEEYTYRFDSQGNITDLLQKGDYDGTADVWYADTVRAGKLNWSRIYSAPAIDNAYIAASANAPIYARDGRLLGVLGIDLLLGDISDFLRGIGASERSRIAIIERDGKLIGSSSPRPVFFNQGEQIERWNIFDYPDPILQAIARHVQTQFGTFKSIETARAFDFSLNGQHQFARIIPWKDEYGLDWLLLMVFPEADFTAQIEANTRSTILLSVGALALAILLGFYTSRRIATPIAMLTKATQAIADGNLERKIPPSFIQELDSVAQSFNRMVLQLKYSFADLERINHELETRVIDRTQELSDKNTQLNSTLVRLQRTQSRVIQAEKMSALGQMVAGVAHEINNPVNFIHGNLKYVNDYSQELLKLVQSYQQHFPDPPLSLQEQIEAVELDFLSEDLIKLLNSMRGGTERIRSIIESLRNFSRLDEAECKVVDLHEGIESTLTIVQNRLQATAQRPAIQVVKNYSAIPWVECYAAQLNQVFLHLLGNAIDAVEEAYQKQSVTPEIRIETSCTPERVRIGITDNGTGMSEEVRARIFDPFFTTKPVGKGTGLGLAISYQIVTETHVGDLTCDSHLGEGTRFEIELPIRFNHSS